MPKSYQTEAEVNQVEIHLKGTVSENIDLYSS